eukprot:m51a1_g3779 hypothetical protein (112) ;mRNA; r:156433-156885
MAQVTENPQPRVNKGSIESFQGWVVRAVGRVMSSEGPELVLESTDGQNLVVHGAPLPSTDFTEYVEVIGLVNPDCSINASAPVTNYGDKLDTKTYNKLIELSQHYRHLFFV